MTFEADKYGSTDLAIRLVAYTKHANCLFLCLPLPDNTAAVKFSQPTYIASVRRGKSYLFRVIMTVTYANTKLLFIGSFTEFAVPAHR